MNNLTNLTNTMSDAKYYLDLSKELAKDFKKDEINRKRRATYVPMSELPEEEKEREREKKSRWAKEHYVPVSKLSQEEKERVRARKKESMKRYREKKRIALDSDDILDKIDLLPEINKNGGSRKRIKRRTRTQSRKLRKRIK